MRRRTVLRERDGARNPARIVPRGPPDQLVRRRPSGCCTGKPSSVSLSTIAWNRSLPEVSASGPQSCWAAQPTSASHAAASASSLNGRPSLSPPCSSPPPLQAAFSTARPSSHVEASFPRDAPILYPADPQIAGLAAPRLPDPSALWRASNPSRRPRRRCTGFAGPGSDTRGGAPGSTRCHLDGTEARQNPALASLRSAPASQRNTAVIPGLNGGTERDQSSDRASQPHRNKGGLIVGVGLGRSGQRVEWE